MGVQVPPRVPFILHSIEDGKKVAYIAQSVEHILGKDEVSGSSPDVGSIFNIDISFFRSRNKNNKLTPNKDLEENKWLRKFSKEQSRT